MPDVNLIKILQQAGFRGPALKTAYGIAMRESGGRPTAFNGNTGTGDRSYGLFQINMLGSLGPSRVRQFGLSSEKDLLDPVTNARAAFRLSKQGKDFGAWGIGPNAYRQGAGFDTIKKYVDAFPGAAPATPVRSLAKTAGDPWQKAVKEGRWKIGSSLGDTLKITKQINDEFAHQDIPGSPGLKYPKLKGRVDSNAAPIVAEAYKWLGTPYSWAGGGLGGPSKGVGRGANTVGFDCSGFLQYLWGQQGIEIPRVTYDQWRTGMAVGRNELQPGDAVFFHPGPRGPEHVGVFLGNGKFAEAPKTGDVVKISALAGRRDYMGARRYGVR